ncbi:fibronectin type III domain-containing protein [Desulfogranum japonicum]|uniref:fibronectin type III domain-containing protein n=1 Tax=Desulfogranum japonicum TaxID=231447 RepID=UPI0004123235|nr:fibronectin type III domain-containing protein [Desulfogranum japonicum]
MKKRIVIYAFIVELLSLNIALSSVVTLNSNLYDSNDRLLEEVVHNTFGYSVSIKYTYDKSGNILFETKKNDDLFIADTDFDHISDSWENYYFSNLTTASLTSDYDNDKYSDYWEYQNWRAHVLDPNGNPFNPLVANAPNGRGYELDASSYPPENVTNPSPADGAQFIARSPTFSWTASAQAESYKLYLGQSSQLSATELVYDNTTTSYALGSTLIEATKYYWRVDACKDSGTNCSIGNTWSFRTEGGTQGSPDQVTVAVPADGAEGQGLDTDLTWQGVEGATAYNIYFGTSSTPQWVKRQGAVPGENSYSVSGLTSSTVYYWRIDAVNGYGQTLGTVWQFKTGSNSSSNEPLIAENLWFTPGDIYAHPDDSVKTRVFEASCDISNRGTSSEYIEQIALGIFYPGIDGLNIINLYNPDTWEPRYLSNFTLPADSTVSFPLSVGSLKAAGTYVLRVNIMQNGVWRAIGSKVFEVLPEPAEPPMANAPFPESGMTNVPWDVTFTWSNTGSVYPAGNSTPPYVVYLGTDSNFSAGDYVATPGYPQYKPSQLTPGTKYYWRVVSLGPTGQTLGPLWSFTTMPESTEPSGQMSVQFNGGSNTFTASYTVNTNTEQAQIYYSYDSGATWNKIYDKYISTIRSSSPDLTLPDVESHTTVQFFLRTIRNSGTAATADTTPIRVGYSITEEKEAPIEPSLFTLGSPSISNAVTIRWLKVLDSTYTDTITNYELQYGTSSSFANPARKMLGNPAVGGNLYETLSCPISNLADGNTYYFRIRATNQDGLTSDWSNTVSTTIEINDAPSIDSTYQEPANGSTDVSKEPVLRWRGLDPENDSLYYGVRFGTSPDNLDSLVSINDLDRRDETTLALPYSWQNRLLPGTTYYWQVITREQGHYIDTYGGTYPSSPVWSFTTENTGPDPAIVAVNRVGEIKPDSSVLFQVTVRNDGSESVGSLAIGSSYIKGGTETPFRIGSGSTGVTLAPGEETTVDISVQFQNEVITQDGIEYDNVLVAGESIVQFSFKSWNENDINTANNSQQIAISYTNPGGPVISLFDLREHESLYYAPADFWVRTGKALQIVVVAEDDTRIVRGTIEFRKSSSDSWVFLYDGTNNSSVWSFTDDGCLQGSQVKNNSVLEWVPSGAEVTDTAEMRLQLWDENDETTLVTSSTFSIVSGELTASIQPADSVFNVGQNISWNVSWSGGVPVVAREIWLRSGARMEQLVDEYDAGGLSLTSPETVTLPDNNSLASQNCTLEMTITDASDNVQKVVSNSFQIQDNQELPAPFNAAITLYDDEFTFPAGSIRQSQERTVEFVKLDSGNNVHAIVRHEYHYIENTESGVAEDLEIFEQNYYYVVYSPLSQTLSAKILVCENPLEVVAFDLLDDIPYVLLKDHRETLSYTYLDSGSFVIPKVVENEEVPMLNGSLSEVESMGTGDFAWVKTGTYAYLSGEIWSLDIPASTITKRTFTAGNYGGGQAVTVTNNAGNVECDVVQPAIVSDTIYCIEQGGEYLIEVDTASLVVEKYALPFSAGSTDAELNKTALLSSNSTLFLFGNGHTYSFNSSTGLFVDNGEIAFTFDSQSFSVASVWNDVFWLRTVQTEADDILLVRYKSSIGRDPYSIATQEFLDFNSQTTTFSRNIVEDKNDATIGSFSTVEGSTFPFAYYPSLAYIGNNVAVAVSAAGGQIDSAGFYDYHAGLQLINLVTGDVSFVDYLPLVTAENRLSLIYENGSLNLLASNEATGQDTTYLLDILNATAGPVQIEEPKLHGFNGQMWATWSNGVPFDGRWDDVHAAYLSKSLERNFQYNLSTYPTAAEYIDPQMYLGYSVTANEGYLSTSDGTLWELYPDFSRGEMIAELADSDGYVEMVFTDAQNAGCFYKWLGGGLYSNTIVAPDGTLTAYQVPSQWAAVAVLPDKIITAGAGSGNYSGENVVVKYDLTTDDEFVIPFRSTGDTYNYENRVDINQNQYVAVGWDRYLALADFSQDIVAPIISITSAGGEITPGTEITVDWQVSDNLSQLDRVEIVTQSGATENLVTTITDSAVTSYSFTLSGAVGESVTVMLAAYDTAGNVSYDTVVFELVQPVTVISFSVDKTNINVGDSLVFSWSVDTYSPTSTFIISARPVGTAEWQVFATVSGQLQVEQVVNQFIGEYEFQITSSGGSVLLSHGVAVFGELLQFAYEQFAPQSQLNVPADGTEDCRVGFNWAVSGVSSPDDIHYSLYLSTDGASSFTKVQETDTMQINYLFDGACIDFSWKIEAEYHGSLYVSQVRDITVQSIQSPAISDLEVTHGTSPVVAVSFVSNSESGLYHVMRQDSSGSGEEIALVDIESASQNGGICATGICTVEDTTTAYGNVYTYYIVSSLADNYFPVGESRQLDLTGSQTLSVTNGLTVSASSQILTENSCVLTVIPGQGNAFSTYEVRLGFAGASPSLYTITADTSIVIDGLEYNNIYTIWVYGLDPFGNRLTLAPAKVTVQTPQVPVAPKPHNLNGIVVGDQVQLYWDSTLLQDIGFMVERKLSEETSFTEIGQSGVTSFVDSDVPSMASYRVRGITATGLSEYSEVYLVHVNGINDIDQDGIDDDWERYYFNDLETANHTSDSDGDGYSDFNEYINWDGGVFDPDGKMFNPTVANIPGGTGYLEQKSNILLLMLPVLINAQAGK